MTRFLLQVQEYCAVGFRVFPKILHICDVFHSDGIFHDADKIRTRQCDRRDAENFKLCGCTAARCGAGPSGRVADDDGVNAGGLHLARGIFLTDQTIALREGVDRQHFDAGKIRLE